MTADNHAYPSRKAMSEATRIVLRREGERAEAFRQVVWAAAMSLDLAGAHESASKLREELARIDEHYAVNEV